MILRPPRSTLTDTLFPYTTLFRSCGSARTMSARRERIMARIIASGLLFVALLAFTLFAFTQQRAKRIAAQPGWALTAIEDVDIPPATAASSDERRVGKECDSTCRTR